MKRKILAVVLMTCALSVNAHAVTPSLEVPHINIPDFNVPPIEGIDVDSFLNSKLKTPKVEEASYYHSPWWFRKSSLKVDWNDVKEAKEYLIELNFDDSTKVFHSDESEINLKMVCPKANGPATVRVKAVNDKADSFWSVEKRISCNQLH